MSASAWIKASARPAVAWQIMERPPTTEAAGQPSPETDVQLLRHIAAGDSAALGQFYDAHSGVLFGLAFRILNDHKEAEDVLQEIFLQIWEKAAVFDPTQGRPLSWAIALTRNKAIDRLRSAQRRSRLFERAGAEGAALGEEDMPSALDAVGAGELAKMVGAALKRLPMEQQRAIEMAFFGGLTQTEIAAALNEPLGTIKARIRRGMLRLREELEPGLQKEAGWGSPVAGNLTE